MQKGIKVEINVRDVHCLPDRIWSGIRTDCFKAAGLLRSTALSEETGTPGYPHVSSRRSQPLPLGQPNFKLDRRRKQHVSKTEGQKEARNSKQILTADLRDQIPNKRLPTDRDIPQHGRLAFMGSLTPVKMWSGQIHLR